jgi:hypothetical protein
MLDSSNILFQQIRPRYEVYETFFHMPGDVNLMNVLQSAIFQYIIAQGFHLTARGPNAAHDTSSCGLLRIGKSLTIGSFLEQAKSGLRLRPRNSVSRYLFTFVISVNFILLMSQFIIW